MPKKFEDFESKKENYADFRQPNVSVDPNFTINDVAMREIRNKNNAIFVMTSIGRGLFSLITSPLTVLQVSLQLSVLPNKNKYGDLADFDKNELMKTPKEVTAYERRRYELIVKSGVTGTNKPFRAPVYMTYREAFKALKNQGILGFYKGNLFGLSHVWMNSYMRYSATNAMTFSDYLSGREPNLYAKAVYVFTSAIIADVLTHPLQVIQSRFILQNRLPTFRLYKSFFHILRKHYRRLDIMFQGARVHVPKNILYSAGFVTLSGIDPLLSFVLANILSQTLIYPLTTVIRRLECQDVSPGMLPKRYSGGWHAFKLILNEEGLRGLFRGYCAFLPAHIATSIFILGLHVAGEQSLSIKSQ